MFRSRFRGILAVALTICSVWTATPAPAQAPASNKLKLAYIAPDDCIFFVTWNGWSEPNPKSTNRTERLLAEESLKDFGNQLMAEINKAIDHAVKAEGNEQAAVAAQTAPTLLKLVLSHPGALYLKSFTPADNPDIEAAVVVDAEKDGPQAIDELKKLLALIPKEGPQGAIEEK